LKQFILFQTKFAIKIKYFYNTINSFVSCVINYGFSINNDGFGLCYICAIPFKKPDNEDEKG
jgi:hypothetical protein